MIEHPIGARNGVNRLFLLEKPIGDLFMNGIPMQEGVHYRVLGNTIEFLDPVPAEAVLIYTIRNTEETKS